MVKSRARAGAAVLDVLTILPNSLPGIVVAVGLILAWNQPWLPFTPLQHRSDPAARPIAGHLLPQPVRYATAALPPESADNP